MNAFRQLMKAAGGHPPIGTGIGSASPLVAEAVAHCGLRLGGARHGAFAARTDEPAASAACRRRHQAGPGGARAGQRSDHRQARARPRRHHAAGAVRRDRRAGPAGRGLDALCAGRRARTRHQLPRCALRRLADPPAHRQPDHRPHRRAGNGGGARSSSRRSARSTASTRCSSARATCRRRWARSGSSPIRRWSTRWGRRCSVPSGSASRSAPSARRRRRWRSSAPWGSTSSPSAPTSRC